MRYAYARIWMFLHLGSGIFAGWLSANLLTEWKIADPGRIMKMIGQIGSLFFAGNKALGALLLILLVGGTLHLFRHFFSLRSDRERRWYRILFFLYGFLYAATITFFVRNCLQNLFEIHLFA